MCPQLLLQANTKGETPLHFAARYGHSNAVKVLIDRAKTLAIDPENGPAEEKKMLRMTNEEKDTALHVAARNIQAKVVKILTEEDPYFSYSANVHGETPLYIAANMRFVNILFSLKYLFFCSLKQINQFFTNRIH
jgi:ankyrin repeat protein